MVDLKEGQPCPWELLLNFSTLLGHIELSQKGNQKICRINSISVTALTSFGGVPTTLSDPVTVGGTDLILLIISRQYLTSSIPLLQASCEHCVWAE